MRKCTDTTGYKPVMKWKLGEYQALERLTSDVKDGLTPVLEIPDVGFDFETEQPRETLDEHLGDVGVRLGQKWTNRECFIDLGLIPATKRMADGTHPVSAVFEDIRNQKKKKALAIPVTGLDRDAAYRNAVTGVAAVDKRGVCVRISPLDINKPGFARNLLLLMVETGVPLSHADLIVDMGRATDGDPAMYARTRIAEFAQIPNLDQWRSFTLAGASYPSSISNVPRPFGIVPRREWIGYRTLLSMLPAGMRVPGFGDYAAANPQVVTLDPRLIDPAAKLRYAMTDAWHIGRGVQVKANGFGQYRHLCADVVAQPYFAGRAFSAGDEYIHECAAGRASTGNLTTWVWVGTNHHLTWVVRRDLATGLAPAAAA